MSKTKDLIKNFPNEYFGTSADKDVTVDPNDTTAGRLLTTDAGPSQAYKQSNIVGTVSQSGGVPTGAIIQRGSNANGEWVRYADGTQICTATKPIITGNDPSRGYPLDSLSRAERASFPAFFVGNSPAGFVSIQHDASLDNRDWFYTSLIQTNIEKWTIRGNSDSGVTEPEDFYFCAIGRWY